MPVARAPLNRRTPRSRKFSSSAAATSASLAGSTCWRLTIRVTSQPNDLNMWTNSTPVTPEPITTRCSGSDGGGYASRVVSTRSPSTSAQSGMRGREPVETSTASASKRSSPSTVSATTSFGPDHPAGALHDPHALALEQPADRVLEAGLDAADPLLERLEVELGVDLGEAHALRCGR